VKNRRGVKKYLASKKELNNYEKYLAFCNLIPVEVGIRGEEIAPTQISTLWRERKTVLALVGSRCKHCGTPQYPIKECVLTLIVGLLMRWKSIASLIKRLPYLLILGIIWLLVSVRRQCMVW